MVVLALVLAGAGAWVVATRVESPAQAAARAEAPAPDPVVAALDRGTLQGPVSVSTTAQRERTVAIKPPAAVTGVVTFVDRAVGETLKSGSVLLRANGRPVFVLPGSFALYRDLQPTDTGDDVAAVQTGLTAAGYSVGRDRSGVYGAGTQSAVRRMYKAAGYTAPEATAADGDADANTDADPSAGANADPGSAESSTPAVAGPLVLKTEIMMIAELPAVVRSVAAVGTQLSSDADLVTLGAGQLVLSATLPSSSVGALTVGATGTFTDDAGVEGTAQVTALIPNPSTAETVLSLSAGGAVTPGTAYVITIGNPAAETGESLLAPVAAVVTRGGRSYVYPRNDAAFREVEVRVTGSVGGVAAIVAMDTSVPLEEGTEVRIG